MFDLDTVKPVFQAASSGEVLHRKKQMTKPPMTSVGQMIERKLDRRKSTAGGWKVEVLVERQVVKVTMLSMSARELEGIARVALTKLREKYPARTVRLRCVKGSEVRLFPPALPKEIKLANCRSESVFSLSL